MPKYLVSITILLLLVLVACIQEDAQELPATPAPTESAPVEDLVSHDTPFALEIGQSGTVEQANLTITFEDVERDGRCPSAVICAENGPVVIIVSASQDETPLTTFTMNPDPQLGQLTGIPPHTFSFEGYEIELTAVDPYPEQPEDLLNLPYTATFIVRRTAAN